MPKIMYYIIVAVIGITIGFFIGRGLYSAEIVRAKRDIQSATSAARKLESKLSESERYNTELESIIERDRADYNQLREQFERQGEYIAVLEESIRRIDEITNGITDSIERGAILTDELIEHVQE